MKKIYGWWFCGETLRDGSPIPPDGEWLEFKGEVQMCVSGLHFSDTPAQALEYAPGGTLCYVELENVVQRDETKGVCTRRKIIARMDAIAACRYIARMNALSVSHLWDEKDDPDDVVLDWLLTGDESAWASARDSARASAWDSAWASAWASARDSAWASAWASARDSARDRFNELIYECFSDVL